MTTVRTFIDSRGVRWEVSEFLAQHGDSNCLRFTSPADVRDFCPLPDEWETLPDSVLERLCRKATPEG
ncbi:MAG: hypothetical protein H0W30_07390 [Gemmatimonadaceae bacterium]|nr:hypothetical protein [Gemmatimonadaceae bacterium]MDQ3520112.1 hypothetical protein [Gemmatimonadota bacterium]